MAGRGVHFQLDDNQLAALIACSADEMPDHVANEIEEAWGADPSLLPGCETDKSWAYIHAALNGVDPDGPLVMGVSAQPSFFGRMFGSRSASPINDARRVIMGDTSLVDSDEYYLGLTKCDRVAEIASGLEFVSAAELASRVKKVHRRFEAAGDAEEVADYAVSWYPALVAFYRDATAKGRHIIFSVDF